MNKNSKWKFSDTEDTAVFTTKQVSTGNMQILYVSHDGEDGSWEFYGKSVDMKNAILIPLKKIVELDKTVNDLSDLPCGWIATRNSKNDPWKKEQNED